LNQGKIFVPPAFSALRSLSALITERFSPKKICLKAAGWDGLKDRGLGQPLEFIFFATFLPVFFGRSKNTINLKYS